MSICNGRGEKGERRREEGGSSVRDIKASCQQTVKPSLGKTVLLLIKHTCRSPHTHMCMISQPGTKPCVPGHP